MGRKARRPTVAQTTVELNAENALLYLRDRHLVSSANSPRILSMGGGISNTVLMVEDTDDCFVLKQSLPQVRVEEYWPFDRRRILVERACIDLLQQLLPSNATPSVRFADDQNFILAMSCAPLGGVIWKEQLMAGHVETRVAGRVGDLLADLHNRTHGDGRVQARFSSQLGFLEGRIEPYHRTAAKRHPDLAVAIEDEVTRILATRLALVHGDYSPKNMVVYPDHIFLLDFEVAHYGDPAFDIAFCLNHLLLKAIRFPQRSPSYLAAARELWDRYVQRLHPELADQIELHTVRELGCLVLARIDGKSKVEYISKEGMKDFTRRLGRSILIDGYAQVADVLELFSRAISVEEVV